MRVLDDEGRVFGRVNVVDAIVVLGALALIAGGIFVVVGGSGGLSDDPANEPLRYATVSYEVPLDNPATRLSAGETLGVDASSAEVTDVHRSTTINGTAHVAARVEYRGSLDDNGNRLLAGERVTVETETARAQARVLVVDLETDTIDTSERSLVLSANATGSGVHAVAPGDAVSVGGDTVGTIEAVDDDASRVGVTLTARETAAGPAFGGEQLRVGTRIGLVTDEAVVRGQIAALGTSDVGDVDR